MKKILPILLLSGACCFTAFADDIYFSTDFESGLPAGITLLDRDENPNKSGLGKIDLTGGTWTLNLVLEKQQHAMLSSAYCTYNYSVDDWMILPSINVKSQNAVLAWDAFSVHYDFRENYKIMISQGSNNPSDFVEVYSVKEEEYFARRHAISLADYVGKDIYIAFVHTGKNKFLLGIDNIKVGEFTGDYALYNNTDVSAVGGTELFEVCGALRNLSSYHTYCPVLIVGEEEHVNMINCCDAQVGEDLPFSFRIPLPEEGKLEYTFVVKNGTGEIVWSESDAVYCSAFPRNILVEEFTGTWCNNCPQGTVTLHKFEHKLRNRIIPVVGHSYPDPMYNDTYHNGLNYFLANVPSMIYDRQNSYKSQTADEDGNIYKVMEMPVKAQIESSVKYTDDQKFEVTSTVRVAEEIDNTSGDYRVGYIITENVVHSDAKEYAQANAAQFVQNREYYFLPSAIPAEMMYYHDVARGTGSAFEGVVNSLPAEFLTPGIDYQVVDTVELPTVGDPNNYQIDPRNISITTVVLRNRTRGVLNSYRVHNDDFDWSSGVESAIQEQSTVSVKTVGDNVLVEGFEGRATVCLYGMDGRIIDTATGASQVVVNAGAYRGVAIVAVESAAGSTFNKILIK